MRAATSCMNARSSFVSTVTRTSGRRNLTGAGICTAWKRFAIAPDPGRDMFPVGRVGGQCGRPNQGVDRDALNGAAVWQTVFDHVVGMCGPECREHAAWPADVDRRIVACGANDEPGVHRLRGKHVTRQARRRRVRETSRRRTSRPLPPAHRLPDSSSSRERPARRLQCAAARGNGR